MTQTGAEVFDTAEIFTGKREQHPRVVREKLSHLQTLEAESIYILREAAAELSDPVMLYSIGKDSSVMLRLAQKAFFPGKIPFPLLHIDTGYKFPEMIKFRDSYTKEIGAELLIHKNEEAIQQGTNPFSLGTQKCCGLLKTKSLLDALKRGGFNAAFGGARRDEEKSRAKERIYSLRDSHGQWDPKNQRPELWNLFNARIAAAESIRVFPLSNWTELDIWLYIHAESIPIVPLYYARQRGAPGVVGRFGLSTVALTLLTYLPYYWQSGRYLLAPSALLGVAAAAFAVRAISHARLNLKPGLRRHRVEVDR